MNLLTEESILQDILNMRAAGTYPTVGTHKEGIDVQQALKGVLAEEEEPSSQQTQPENSKHNHERGWYNEDKLRREVETLQKEIEDTLSSITPNPLHSEGLIR